MVLTVQQCLSHIQHALLGRQSEEVHGRALINEAGEALVAYHPWKWLDRGDTRLTLRGKTEIPLGAAYTHAGAQPRLVASTGTFSDYTFTSGDQMTVTTVGDLVGVSRLARFGIASAGAAPDDEIILTGTGLGSANDGMSAWAGEIAIPYALLPTDFMELIGYDTTNSLVNSLELTTFQHLLELRTNQIEIAAWNFWGVISWFEDQTDSNRVKPRLDIWPDPPAGTTETLSIFYKTSWPRVLTSDEEVKIPEWMEPLYIHWLRAYAKGYEDDADDQPSLNQRLISVVQGPVYMGALDRDGRIQPEYGPMRGGAVMSMPTGHNRYLRTTVAGPS